MDKDRLLHLIEMIQKKAPAYFDLVTAKTDAEFEAAFDLILEQCVIRLESEAKLLKDQSEDGISAYIAGFLTIPGLSVTRETNSRGHVDITITAEHCFPARTKLAEAKIWRGATYHIGGLDQLIGRYATGREGRGLMLSYMQGANIKSLIGKLLEELNANLPCSQQGAAKAHTLKWSLLSVHKHSSGETVEVAHVGCNLHV